MLHHKPWLSSLPAGLGLWLVFTLLRLLPLDTASALGGFIGRHLGPYLKWHRIAAANLRWALPKRASEHAAILNSMWDNLGRTLTEYPHLNSSTMASRIILPRETLDLLASGNGAIFASGHLGNWEIAPLAAHLYHQPLTLIYRHVSNPIVERLIFSIRSRYCAALYPKGNRGAREVLRALKKGSSLGMLVDQRMNDGIEVPFFNKPAMTAQATAMLALRYGAPIILARVIRKQGANFELELSRLPLPEGETEENIREVMLQIHRHFERWIAEYPAQWLWIHRRWGNAPLQNDANMA